MRKNFLLLYLFRPLNIVNENTLSNDVVCDLRCCEPQKRKFEDNMISATDLEQIERHPRALSRSALQFVHGDRFRRGDPNTPRLYFTSINAPLCKVSIPKDKSGGE